MYFIIGSIVRTERPFFDADSHSSLQTIILGLIDRI
jgi:hypothetical protein